MGEITGRISPQELVQTIEERSRWKQVIATDFHHAKSGRSRYSGVLVAYTIGL
jgi:hypothetical protein